MITYTEKKFFDWVADDVSVTLRNCGGSYGGGSETLVINGRSKNMEETVGALMASGYAKNGTQEAMNGMYVTTSWDGSQTAPTLTKNNAGGGQRMPDKDNFNAVIQPVSVTGGQGAETLDSHYFKGCGEREGKEREVVAQVASVDCRNGVEDAETNGTLQSKKDGGISYNTNNTVRQQSVVRRLTPTEAERLQGFPDGWTLIGEPEEVEVKDYDVEYDEDGNEVGKTFIGTHREIEYFYIDRNGKRKKCADSARYKALGNSIALPFWAWLARRICAQYERPMTMASLFDGIGGFPLVFSRAGCTPVWASEIEEFPIEVTQRRFPE